MPDAVTTESYLTAGSNLVAERVNWYSDVPRPSAYVRVVRCQTRGLLELEVLDFTDFTTRSLRCAETSWLAL